MTDIETIAKGLTEAQRDALLAAEIMTPTFMLPNYIMMDMPNCGMSALEADELQVRGLVSIPVRIGDRSSTVSYSGEIHPLGQSVRDYLKGEK